LVLELRRAGFEPSGERAETEAEFVALLEPPPDVILSDFSLPQWSGLDALRVVRERGLDVPVIIVSGTMGEDRAVAAMREGAVDYLLKDRLARLGPAVASAVVKRSALATTPGPPKNFSSAGPAKRVSALELYAPTAMNPAWPSENWPVWPFTRFKLVARMMLIPTKTRTPTT
jgi:CheY-like chemotaxis protein